MLLGQWAQFMALLWAEAEMASEGKKNILLSFEDELLLDARKALFRKNVSIQQFVTFALHRLVLADEAAVDLLERAAKYNQEALTHEDKAAIAKIDPRSLYDMFEREDNK